MKAITEQGGREAPIKAEELLAQLKANADPAKAEHSKRFFKTAPGQYGEGDVFLGLTVPQVREISRQGRGMAIAEMERLLANPYHEARLCALQVMVDAFRRARKDESYRGEIIASYLRNYEHINNWDLVDLSVSILGEWLWDKDRSLLYESARSKNMWQRRMAMVSTMVFIKRDDLDDALAIARILLSDKQDLTHKAVGWMLREVGKRDVARLEEFLRFYYSKIPRTTLRYAIERFPEDARKAWLHYKG